MPVNITNRADAEAIIREQIVSNIFQDAPKNSVFMGMARKLPNMTSNQTRIRVLDFLPTAYWVDGDTGMKQTTRQAWDNVYLNAGELAVIVPIPDAVLSDSEFDIFGEITPRVMEAIGQKVDAAVIFGDNRPREWQADLITLARQAGNNVSPAAGKDYYDLILGENGVFAKVEDDGYGVSGALAPMNFKSKLRGLRDTTGQPIFKSNMQDVARYTLDGAPITFPENGSFYANIAQLVVGDFGQAVYAIRQDVTVKILTEGVIQDLTTREIVYNLAQQDMTALRVVFRMGWALPNPATRMNEDRTGCAFAYLEPGTPIATQKVTFTVTDVQTSTDGSTFTNALVSTVNEPSKSYTVSSLDRSIVSVRFILYAADGTTNQLDMQSVPVVIDVDALTHEEIFNLLTNNGFIKGVYKEGNQLYFSFTYAKGGTLKLGGPNNGYGTFEVYDANGNIITQIDNSVGFKNFKGKEWFQINESVATAGYDSSLVHGLLDLSAQYSDGYWTVLESKQAGLLLKTVSRMKVETTGSSSLTLNVPEMPKLITGSNLGKNSNGDVGTIASSSMRYKILGKTVKEDELEELYRIKVIWAKYKDGYLMEQDERCGKEMPMFIAEDIDRRFPIVVDHDEKGRAENWNYRIMIPCMFAMLKNEHEKVKELQSELDFVKAELEELKQLIKQHISTEV